MPHKGTHNPDHLAKLLEGKDAWNAWRDENPDIEPNLRGIDTTPAIHLSGFNLSGADLAEATLWGADLRGADLSGAKLWSADLSGVYLMESDLSGAKLWSANLSGAWLRGADLSGAELDKANLSRAVLGRANLSGAYLPGADLSRAALGRANLSGAHLLWAILSGANLNDSDLSDADLWGADLSRAALGGANLSGANLDIANLSGADLRSANLSGAYHLDKATLSGADLSTTDLSGEDLKNVNFSGTTLKRVNLSGADLTRARFAQTEGRSADLTGADLRQAQLHLADLENAVVADVRYLGAGTFAMLRDYVRWAAGRFGPPKPRQNWRALEGKTDIPPEAKPAAVARDPEAKEKQATLRRTLPPRFDEKCAEMWGVKPRWLRVFHPLRIFLYLWQCRGRGIMQGCYEGINAAECYGNAAFRRDAMDQDYIDQLFRRCCRRTPKQISNTYIIFPMWLVYDYRETWYLRSLLFGAWGLIDYGRSLSRILLWGAFVVFIFGGIYIDLAQPPMPGLDFPLGADSPLHYADPARRLCGVHAPVEYTANTGIANGFTPYYVAAVTFSTLGFTDIAVPYNLKAQIVLLANALFGYIVFGLLLSILANVIARRAGG